MPYPCLPTPFPILRLFGDFGARGCGDSCKGRPPLQFSGTFRGSVFSYRASPDLPFLAFLHFLAFFVAPNFLAFLSVFRFFPRDFRGSAERKILAFFGGFPCFFQKKQGKEDQGRLENQNFSGQFRSLGTAKGGG